MIEKKIRIIVDLEVCGIEDLLGRSMKRTFWNDSNVIYLIVVWVTQLYTLSKLFQWCI